MNIRDCYESFGGNFNEALMRFLERESMVAKYARRFLDDATFSKLEAAMATGDFDEIFRASHTMKGVCLNLSFAEMGKACVTLTDMVRRDASGALPAGLTLEKVQAAFADVKTEYDRVVGALSQLD